jgi:hypothetical protein
MWCHTFDLASDFGWQWVMGPVMMFPYGGIKAKIEVQLSPLLLMP